ncbi:unnamed protein product [Haemonchus placei]|uniref:Uncharacterized protein n=1 Tax=Haemonchus placei TaxID=6290 RepID=A0A0N4XBA7_HAEPC|nr:unnamed protein product [Haemonchus placei]
MRSDANERSQQGHSFRQGKEEDDGVEGTTVGVFKGANEIVLNTKATAGATVAHLLDFMASLLTPMSTYV